MDPVALTQALIRCPSVTPRDAGALGVLEEALKGLGFACNRLRFGDGDESTGETAVVDNLYARLGDAAPNFCFAGHTDVVPVGNAADWTSDPFAAEVRDGQLYGRGAVDMKSAIAAFVCATSAYLNKHGAPPGSISLLITGDEEGPALNGTKKVLNWLTDNGEVLDACVVGEPTNPTALGDMIKIGRRGSLTGYLTVHGVQGHTAYPHLADNPVHRVVAMLAALMAQPLDTGTDHFQPSTLQVSTVDVGNDATNVIPGEARATFNIRFNDHHTGAGLSKWLRQTLDGVGGSYDLDVRISGESFVTPPGLLSEVVAGAIEAVLGRTPELSTTGGTSDARFIKDHCPVAEFGLVGQTMHKIDEHVAVADIEKLSQVYEAILERYFARATAA